MWLLMPKSPSRSLSHLPDLVGGGSLECQRRDHVEGLMRFCYERGKSWTRLSDHYTNAALPTVARPGRKVWHEQAIHSTTLCPPKIKGEFKEEIADRDGSDPL